MFKATTFKKVVIVGILIHAFLLAYFLIFHQYFQQDEWHGFGIIFSQGIGYVTLDKSILELLLGDRVGARIITFGLFNFFHLNPMPYGVFAFTMQFLNTFLVFLLAKKLTKHVIIALLASLFFLMNELGNEAYTWFGTMTGSLTATTFFLLSLLLFLKFIDSQKYKFVILSTILLWLSFLFKEVAAFAFIFYPILFIVYSQKRNLKALLKAHFPLIILGVIMFFYFAKTVLFIPGDRANYIGTGGSLIPSLLTHTIQYPLEGLVQTIIPNQYLFLLSDIATRIINPNLSPDSLDFLVAAQTYNAELTLIALLIIFSGIFFLLMKKILLKMDPSSKKALQISVIMTLLSFLPYIVINRSFSYLDSRYYYLGTIGIAIFLATLIFNLLNANKKIFKIIAVLIFISYAFIHESTLFSDLKLMADRSQERQMFLKQIESLVPILPKKIVFFITGDSQGYYGLPELKTPFQSGLGHVLMIVYTTKGQLSSAFFNETTLIKVYDVGFLYDILGQGYREVNEQGFGYYYSYSDLKKALNQKLFEEADVISLYYKHQDMKLIRIPNDFARQ